jgi:hypothetical protein
VLQPLRQTQQIGDAIEVCRIAVAVAGDFLRHQNIRTGIEGRQQVKLLEHEPDLTLAHARALRVGQSRKIVAIEHHAAAVGASQPSEQVKQRGLSAAGRPHDADELAFLHAEGNSAEGLDFDLAYVIGLAQIFCFDERSRHACKNLTRSRTAKAQRCAFS